MAKQKKQTSGAAAREIRQTRMRTCLPDLGRELAPQSEPRKWPEETYDQPDPNRPIRDEFPIRDPTNPIAKTPRNRALIRTRRFFASGSFADSDPVTLDKSEAGPGIQ